MKTSTNIARNWILRSACAVSCAASVFSAQKAFSAADSLRLQQAGIIRNAITADLVAERSVDTPRLAIPALRELVRSFGSGNFDREDALLLVRLAVDLSETDPSMSFRGIIVTLATKPALVGLMGKCGPGDGFPNGGMPAPIDRGLELEDQANFLRMYELREDHRVRAREVCELKKMFEEHRARRRAG